MTECWTCFKDLLAIQTRKNAPGKGPGWRYVFESRSLRGYASKSRN